MAYQNDLTTANVFEALSDALALIKRANDGIQREVHFDEGDLKNRASLRRATNDALEAVEEAISQCRIQIGREYVPGPRTAPG